MKFRLLCFVTLIIFVMLAMLPVSTSYADPLDNWHVRAPLLTHASLNAIAYGNGIFVAVGSNGTILSSSDGANWVIRSSGTSASLRSIAYGDGLFVAVGYDWNSRGYPQNGIVLRSVDGSHWTVQSTGEASLDAVTYGNGHFISVGDTIAISSEGINWTYEVVPAAFSTITFGNGKFLALGNEFPFYGYVGSEAGYSLDGIQWTFFPLSGRPGGGMAYSGITYGAGMAVAVGAIGCFGIGVPCGGAEIVTSTDMINWTFRHMSGGYILNSISYGLDHFVAVGGKDIVISTDGTTWKRQRFDEVPDLISVTHGSDTFVVVGANGMILQSDPFPLEYIVGVPAMSQLSMMLFVAISGTTAVLIIRKQRRAACVRR